jgi:hypothetical protein
MPKIGGIVSQFPQPTIYRPIRNRGYALIEVMSR